MVASTEKRWLAVSPQPIISNGTKSGSIKVQNACLLFRVGQIVNVKVNIANVEFECYKIKRILDDNCTIFLGPTDKNISVKSDLSHILAVNTPIILANEQNRAPIDTTEIVRARFEEEPVHADRSFLVDSCGNPYTEDNPFPTSASLAVDNISVDIDAKDGDNTAISAHPNQIFDQGADTLDAEDVFKTVFTYTSTSNNTRVQFIEFSADVICKVNVKVNGTTIRSLWTSPIERNIQFPFIEHYPLLVAEALTVEACPFRILKTNSYNTFVSMQSYLCQ
jgi:hypothetical protein